VRCDPIGPATDLYSLGISLWLALEGKSPYGQDLATYEALADAKLGNPPPEVTRPGVPPGLVALVARLMATDPKDRFASAQEAIAFLDAGLARPSPAAPLVGEKTQVEAEPRTIGKFE